MKTEIILIGGGGHCKACIDVIEKTGQFQITGIIDKIEQRVLGYPFVASDDELPLVTRQSNKLLITIGQIKSPEKRLRIYERIMKLGGNLAKVVSPLAYVSRHARIGKGTIVMHGAVVNAGADIGENCIINTRAIVEHDVAIESHCHISTGAVANGNVKIGSRTFVGSQTVIKENVRIGSGCTLSAGVRIMKNVAAETTIRGSSDA